MSDLNRRDFVVAAVCAGACMMCGGAEAQTQPATAPSDAPPSTASTTTKVDIGTIADYAKDGVYDALAQSKRILVVREGAKLFAMSAICTHQMGIVKLKAGELVCAKHNSKFANNGKPTIGQAKAALFHLGISKDEEGKIIVDRNKKFGERQWNDAGASIAVEG